MLLLVAERGGDTILPRIGILRALTADEPSPTPEPRRKRAKAYKIIR